MALSSKSIRDIQAAADTARSDFDFGEPEVIAVEIAPGKFLSLQEPSADDLIEITKISNDKEMDEILATLKTICILHSPSQGSPKLTLKDARRLRHRQIKKLGEAINIFLNSDDEEEKENDMKSEDNDEN